MMFLFDWFYSVLATARRSGGGIAGGTEGEEGGEENECGDEAVGGELGAAGGDGWKEDFEIGGELRCRREHAGNTNHVLHLFDEMQSLNCAPDVVCYTTVIDNLVSSGRAAVAVTLFIKMVSTSLTLDPAAYTILVKLYACHLQQFDLAFEILFWMKKSGCSPDVVTYSTLIARLCQLHRRFNVKDYGAISNGKSDSTMAFFEAAWSAACVVEGSPEMLIPKGPCQGVIGVQLKGDLLAVTNLNAYAQNWRPAAVEVFPTDHRRVPVATAAAKMKTILSSQTMDIPEGVSVKLRGRGDEASRPAEICRLARGSSTMPTR